MYISNFIYVKENALSDEICDNLIRHVDEREALAATLNKDGRNDLGVSYGKEGTPRGNLDREDFQVYQPASSDYQYKEVLDCVFEGLDEYKAQIASVDAQGILVSEVVKLQHTPIGGGFHRFHIEQASGLSCARSLTWLIYLNDVTEGGETEFLYQQQRLSPKKGTLVIWPAGVTHPHRGNPPYSNDKYIATGWFEVPFTETYAQTAAFFKQSKGA